MSWDLKTQMICKTTSGLIFVGFSSGDAGGAHLPHPSGGADTVSSGTEG